MAHDVHVDPRTRIDQVGPTGIHPASGPLPSVPAEVRGQGELAHPEERRRSRLLTVAAWPGNTALLAPGRAIFGGYFAYNGINHLLNHRTMSDYARSKGVPAAAAGVPASGAMILLGGLSLITGVKPKAGASLIAAFLLGVSPRMHAFWAVDDPTRRMAEFVNFTKNMALVGGACFAAALPDPWPLSAEVTAP